MHCKSNNRLSEEDRINQVIEEIICSFDVPFDIAQKIAKEESPIEALSFFEDEAFFHKVAVKRLIKILQLTEEMINKELFLEIKNELKKEYFSYRNTSKNLDEDIEILYKNFISSLSNNKKKRKTVVDYRRERLLNEKTILENKILNYIVMLKEIQSKDSFNEEKRILLELISSTFIKLARISSFEEIKNSKSYNMIKDIKNVYEKETIKFPIK